MEILILSLKNAIDRRNYMIKLFNNQTCTFIDSLSPNNIDINLLKYSNKYLSKEAVATFETHRKTIELSKQKDNYVLILEDDATPYFDDYLNRIDKLISIAPEFDIMVLGWIKGTPFRVNPKSEFIKVRNFLGMHSYIINTKNADKILNVLDRPNQHIDKRISKLISSNKIIGIFPKEKIFYQQKSFKTQIPKK